MDAIKLKLFDPNAEGAPTTLIDLLPELQFAVLSHLPPIELARCRSVCTSLLPLATDDLLWSRLYEQKYGEGPVGGASAGGGAAQAFRMRVKREKEAERERQRLRDRPPPNPYLEGPGSFGHHPGPPLFHDPFGGYGPGSMPGFIGGDFDRMPGGGGLPGFGGNPFGGMGPPGGGMGMGPPGGLMPAGPGGAMLPPGSVPPGARFDPISPLIDQDGMSGGPSGMYGGPGRGRGGFYPGRGGPGGRFGPGGGFPGRGGGRFGGRGGGWGDPDGPDLPDIL